MDNAVRVAGGLLLLLVLLGTATAAENQVDQISQTVDRRYNDLRSLAADFSESYRGAGMARTESGTLWLKRPGKMRWEYRQPRDKLFLTDGKTAYFYVPGEHQARRAPVKKLDDLRSPLRYLLGKTKLQKEFEDLSLAPEVTPLAAGNVVLRGLPRSMADRVSSVLLEIASDGTIQRIVVDEVDGSTTEFRFSNQRENVNIPEERFHFAPPPGVEMIDSADVQP